MSPILVLYSFWGNSITMTDTFIVFFYILSLPFIFIKGIKVVLPYFAIFSYVLFHSAFNLLSSYDRGIFMRAMHTLNYVFLICFYHKLFFNKDLGERLLRLFALLSTLFLIIQQVAISQFGTYISGNLFPQFAIAEANEDLVVVGTNVHRLSSFFAEPATFSMYVICALVHELFYSEKKDMRIVGLFCLGCTLSTSTTAIACMAFLMGFYMYTNRLFRDRNTLLLIMALIAIYSIATPHIDAINRRLEEGRSFSGRFHGYSVMYSLVENPLWGIGFVAPKDLEVYLAGIPRLFVYLGLTGVLVYLLAYINVLFTTKKNILTLVFLFLNIGSDTFFGVSFLYYSCFMISSDYYQNREKINYHNHQLQQRSRT